MAGLQRSSETFRRSGSSGLVWEDRFLPGEADSGGGGGGGSGSNKGARDHEQRAASSTSASVECTRSNGGYRTGRVSPALDPPSPKVSVCGFCTFFGKPRRPNSNGNRRRR